MNSRHIFSFISLRSSIVSEIYGIPNILPEMGILCKASLHDWLNVNVKLFTLIHLITLLYNTSFPINHPQFIFDLVIYFY